MGITYTDCDLHCGPRGSTEAFDWQPFSVAILQWLFPWLALTAQLPYETRHRGSNVMALMLAVGSPMLITYSLFITILNARWLNVHFGRLRSQNEQRGRRSRQVVMLSAALFVLKEIQHVPIVISETRRRFAQLVVNPTNERWWVALREQLKRTKREFTYSLGAQAFFVVVLAFMAMVNFMVMIDRFTVRVFGVAINNIWMWMIPVTVGWVWVGTQNSANTIRECLMEASSKAVFLPDLTTHHGHQGMGRGGRDTIGFQDWSWENRDDLESAGTELHQQPARLGRVQTVPPVKQIYEGCKGEAGPIFNYARFPSHLQTCALVIDMFKTLNMRLHEDATVRVPVARNSEWHYDSDNDEPTKTETETGWKKNLDGTPEEIEAWLFPNNPVPTFSHSINVPLIFIQAFVVAAVLQWGTTGAAVWLAYQTPVVGLGCVSGSYFLYGVAATLVWFLMVFSAYLSHCHAADLSNPSIHMPPLRRMALEFLIPATRYVGKGLAVLNSFWVLAFTLLQFAGRYQNCWCMSVMGRGGWVILWADDQQIAEIAWNSWVGSSIMVSVTVIIVGVLVLNTQGEEIYERQTQ
ncbi:hypothetical protein B0H66DRAFT_605402 [Apodospora peruviana]|uniref:Uncharacterized protein n=1 Tax=Apodospora peruviana TaxID=516989 RepID=A0AAE0HX82_9PEZI|nr:hypothetical protein B0H66DRAFT_605402 [Apodospora peruviana]